MEFFIDGIPLKDPLRRWSVMMDSNVASPIAMRSGGLVLPGVPGTTRTKNLVPDAAPHALDIRVRGNSDADLVRNYSALMGALAGAKTLSRRAGGVTHTASVEFVSATDPKYNIIGKELTAKCVFRVNDVAWRGEETTWVQTSPVANTFYQVTTVNGANYPTNDGLVMVKGPGTDIRVTDQHSGTWLSIAMALGASDKARVNCEDFSVFVGPDVTWDSGGVDMSGKLGLSGSVFSVTPGRVSNDPLYTAAFLKTSGGTELSFRGKAAYLV